MTREDRVRRRSFRAWVVPVNDISMRDAAGLLNRQRPSGNLTDSFYGYAV